MALLTPEQILLEIESLPPHEKDNLEFLLDKKEKAELLKRMTLDRGSDMNENEIFE
ncbi:MAG: hypothetical protein KAS64_09915 [Spirochaetes bacterium]|nr:hypothetical protein [Spirochaetota bacterium]